MSWSHSHAPAIALMLNLRKPRCFRVLGYMDAPRSSLCNRESKSSHLTSLHVSLSLSLNLFYTLPFALQLSHLTSLCSLLTSLTISIRPLLTEATAASLSLLLSPSSYPPYFPFLSPSSHNFWNRQTLLEPTPQQQHWAFGFCPLGFSVCLILFISLSLSGLFLKSAFKKNLPFILSTRDRHLVFITSLSPHVHWHHCLSPLPYVCFTFPASSLHQTHNCSLSTSGFICFIQLFPHCFHRLFLSSLFLFLPSAVWLSSYSFGPLFLFIVWLCVQYSFASGNCGRKFCMIGN